MLVASLTIVVGKNNLVKTEPQFLGDLLSYRPVGRQSVILPPLTVWCQVMSDLLSAWVLTTGDTSQQVNTADLSGALEKARLSYHSQVMDLEDSFLMKISLIS